MLVASATMTTPGKLGRIIDRLVDAGWSHEPPRDGEPRRSAAWSRPCADKDAVDAGLVKKQIILGGYAPRWNRRWRTCWPTSSHDQKAKDLQAGFLPKAIYVCKTNINAEDGGQTSRPNLSGA